MKHEEKINLAEQHGIKFRRDENNDILIKRIPLPKVHINSYDTYPKVNCRDLYVGRLNKLEKTITTKGQGKCSSVSVI